MGMNQILSLFINLSGYVFPLRLKDLTGDVRKQPKTIPLYPSSMNVLDLATGKKILKAAVFKI
jgi:hypothetical protein